MGGMIAMCTRESDDMNMSFPTDAYYEEQASQEEIYLEETEEELRIVLESDDPPLPRSESLDDQRERAAEELIIGDSDEPHSAKRQSRNFLSDVPKGLSQRH